MLGEFVRESVLMVGALSIVPLICTGFASLCIAILQAATQVQEQTISYLAKLFVLFVMCIALGGYASMHTVRYTQLILSQLSGPLL